ncbi:hypothetical protein ON010_g12034 [Phytophthora cinnamomi]|nr:hypothetical protein ON010_g12034 [Phytophthora cinnamomi]
MLLAMNDISETSLELTFIIQITIIGRAVGIKVRLRSIVLFTRTNYTAKSKGDSSVATFRGRAPGLKSLAKRTRSRRESPAFPDIPKVAVHVIHLKENENKENVIVVTITQEDMDEKIVPAGDVGSGWLEVPVPRADFLFTPTRVSCSLALRSFVSQCASHVYFHDGRSTMVALNSISETSLQLTQITIIGRDVLVKVKIRITTWLDYTAEALVLLGWLHVCASCP